MVVIGILVGVRAAVTAALVVGLTVIGIGLYWWYMDWADNPLDDNPFDATAVNPVKISEAPELSWPTERYDARAPEKVREGYTPDQLLLPPSAPDWISCEDGLCLAGYPGSVRFYDTHPVVSFMAEIVIQDEEPPHHCKWWRSRFNPLPGCWKTEWSTNERPYDILVKLGATPGQAARILTPQ